jgi:hypothetical protein
MTGFEEQKKLFSLVGSECKKKIEALVIGGSAMLFYNFSKTTTKDIDIVLFSEEDRKYIIGVLERIGFKTEFSPKREAEPYRLVLDDYILDVFAKNVFKLRISEGILDRVEEKIEFGNLTVSVISPEDIILSKSMTDRVGDREDAVAITKEKNINWDVIIDECIWQSDNRDFRFCIFLYDFLDDMVHDFGIKLPKDAVMKIKKLYRESIERIKPDKN